MPTKVRRAYLSKAANRLEAISAKVLGRYFISANEHNLLLKHEAREVWFVGVGHGSTFTVLHDFSIDTRGHEKLDRGWHSLSEPVSPAGTLVVCLKGTERRQNAEAAT